jgi:hypothetical protein
MNWLFPLADKNRTKVCDRIAQLSAQKNTAYQERNLLVALTAKMASELGCKVGLGYHEGEDWDDEWRFIIFIDLPTGQASWHIHDSEIPLFSNLRNYVGFWDGHSTALKNERIKAALDADFLGLSPSSFNDEEII